MGKKILVPVDFTELSEKVIEQATLICAKTGLGMVLLHIVKHEKDKEPAWLKLEEINGRIKNSHAVSCETKVRLGSIFNEIPDEGRNAEYSLMIIGTHGIKGLKQKLMGADILKLVSKSPVPSLVIQNDFPVKKDFDKIILPVASHEYYKRLVDATCFFGKYYGGEIHLFSIEKPGYEWPESIRQNINMAQAKFEDVDIPVVRTREKQTVLSVGYARQTLQYATKVNADLISVMAVASEEYHYFAQQDKENLVNNEYGIPILFMSDAEQD